MPILDLMEFKSKALLIVVILISLIAFVELLPNPENPNQIELQHKDKIVYQQHPDYDQRANEHLFWQNKKIELQQDTVKFENERTGPRVGDSIISEEDRRVLFSKDSNSGVDFTLDTNEQQSLQDLKRDSPELRAYSPGNVVQAEIADHLKDREHRIRWIKTFIAKYESDARKNGWIIKVKPDLTIETAYQIESDNDAQHKMRTGER